MQKTLLSFGLCSVLLFAGCSAEPEENMEIDSVSKSEAKTEVELEEDKKIDFKSLEGYRTFEFVLSGYAKSKNVNHFAAEGLGGEYCYEFWCQNTYEYVYFYPIDPDPSFEKYVDLWSASGFNEEEIGLGCLQDKNIFAYRHSHDDGEKYRVAEDDTDMILKSTASNPVSLKFTRHILENDIQDISTMRDCWAHFSNVEVFTFDQELDNLQNDFPEWSFHTDENAGFSITYPPYWLITSDGWGGLFDAKPENYAGFKSPLIGRAYPVGSDWMIYVIYNVENPSKEIENVIANTYCFYSQKCEQTSYPVSGVNVTGTFVEILKNDKYKEALVFFESENKLYVINGFDSPKFQKFYKSFTLL